MFSEGYKFRNRYRLTGTLTALTPVHVGDGEDEATVGDRHAELGAADPAAKYNTFVTGHDGAARIPGSTLKGVVRSWLTGRGIPASVLEGLFGTLKDGGKVAFCDAPLQKRAPGQNKDRWWNEQRGTCLAPGVSLKPATRTADEGLLYHTEYVPEGSGFAVTVTAEDLSEEELALLCAAFAHGFRKDEDTIRVGAETADGWGRMEWSGAKLEAITPGPVKAWLEQGAPGSHRKLYRGCEMPAVALPCKAPGRELGLDIRLAFYGALLVNDPSQFRKQMHQQRGVGHAMVRRRDGRYFLPASSVRGALRAQTRKIWQTLSDAKDGDRNGWKGAAEAKRSGEQKKLHALDRMWGAPGWRAPIHVPDFELSKQMQTRRQEFVAVDRFTGGAADEKKFSADTLYGPEFRGTVRVDLDAWERAAVGPWALLLLVFLLRDLREGDVRFGFGSAKGYGACVAEIQIRAGAQGNTEFEALVRGVLERNQVALNDPQLDTFERELMAELEKVA